MNTRVLAGGKAFAAANFQRQAKQVGKQAKKQVKKGAQTAKRQVQKTNTGRTEQDLWIPNAERPFWLDGSLPGDRGFDPFQLARPVDYAQFDLDQNPPSGVYSKGDFKGGYAAPQRYIASSPIAPWNDALGLDRLRENEIINGRWAMLAVLGILVSELVTGVPWQDAGKVELDPSGPTYWGLKLPFSVSQSVWFEVIGVGLAEIFRSQAEDVEDRIYPGGAFDPLKLTEIQDEYRLRESEVLHGRLAMVAFAGLALQAGFRGTGAFGSIDQSTIDAAGAGAI